MRKHLEHKENKRVSDQLKSYLRFNYLNGGKFGFIPPIEVLGVWFMKLV